MKIWSIDYKCGSEPNGYTVPICCTRVWHADAVKTLSSSIRMVFIMDGQRRYAINRADHKLKLGLLGLQGESIANYFHILQLASFQACRAHAFRKMDMRLMFFDSIFVNLLQSCAKLQIQTSLWALYLFADRHHPNAASLEAHATRDALGEPPERPLHLDAGSCHLIHGLVLRLDGLPADQREPDEGAQGARERD